MVAMCESLIVKATKWQNLSGDPVVTSPCTKDDAAQRLKAVFGALIDYHKYFLMFAKSF